MRLCSLDSPEFDVYSLALDAQYETGFFGYLARNIRRYICGDEKIRKTVENSIREASGGKKKIPKITPELIVGTGGLTLGTYLVQSIPVLGVAGAPVIAAVVVVIYTLGVDAFCEWSSNLRTDKDEKN